MTNLKRAVAALIPGTAAHTAKAKRQMERALRAAGHSRKEAVGLTAQYFRSKRGE